MKKIVLVGMVIAVVVFLVYKVGGDAYKNYQMKRYVKQYELNDNNLKNLIFKKANAELKVNDLIYVCELRKGLWGTDIDLNQIQKSAIENNQKYKEFSEELIEEIKKDKELFKHVQSSSLGLYTGIIGDLCTLIDPDTQASISYYNQNLRKKYNDNIGSIGELDITQITKEDLAEYQKAKDTEKRLRHTY